MPRALAIRAPDPLASSKAKETRVQAVSCGADWAEAHHEVAIVDEHGDVLVSARITNNADGLARLLEILSAHDPDGEQLAVAVSRYRDRYRSSRGRSDA